MTEDRPTPDPARTGGAAGGRSFLSRRAALLIVAVALGATSLLGPVKGLLDQRARINELADEQAENIALINQLEAQVERWQDPAFVKAQVRARMHYVLPGEVGYIVLESAKLPAAVSYRLGSTGQPDPWFATLLKSVKSAAGTASGTGEDD